MTRRVDPRDKHMESGFEYSSSLGIAVPRQGTDNVALQLEYRERAKRGRRELIDFEAWLVKKLIFAESTARQVRRRVWAAIEETEGEPWLKLDDPRLSKSYVEKISADLRKWTAFLFDAKRTEGAVVCLNELYVRCSQHDETLDDFIARCLPNIRGRRGGRVPKKQD